MPVANLQSYRSIALRAHTNAFASQGQAMLLEGALTTRLRQKCGFEAVGPFAQTANADVVLDLNIVKVGRGSFNQSQANVDVLVVLTDGRDRFEKCNDGDTACFALTIGGGATEVMLEEVAKRM